MAMKYLKTCLTAYVTADGAVKEMRTRDADLKLLYMWREGPDSVKEIL